ncbi:hypothetical protein CI238_00227, partial [Colletotrichum incanum]
LQNSRPHTHHAALLVPHDRNLDPNDPALALASDPPPVPSALLKLSARPGDKGHGIGSGKRLPPRHRADGPTRCDAHERVPISCSRSRDCTGSLCPFTEPSRQGGISQRRQTVRHQPLQTLRQHHQPLATPCPIPGSTRRIPILNPLLCPKPGSNDGRIPDPTRQLICQPARARRGTNDPVLVQRHSAHGPLRQKLVLTPRTQPGPLLLPLQSADVLIPPLLREKVLLVYDFQSVLFRQRLRRLAVKQGMPLRTRRINTLRDQGRVAALRITP